MKRMFFYTDHCNILGKKEKKTGKKQKKNLSWASKLSTVGNSTTTYWIKGH